MSYGYPIIFCFILCQVGVTHAFYDWEIAQSSGNIRASIRGFAVAGEKPANPLLYDKRDNEAIGGIARLIIGSHFGDSWRIDLNAYQTWLPKSLVSNENGIETVFDVERSGLLERSYSHDHYAHLAVDRLSLRKTYKTVDFILGRQPINLATTFFFSPNDVFAPFAAQAFYRVYKPGVDGLRTDFSLSELTQLSFIGVLGYQEQTGSDSGWSDSAEHTRNSYLVRYTTNMIGMEWSLLTGKVRRSRITGGSLSGELFGWLGLRTEGHVVEELDKDVDDATEMSIGLEHRWANSLYLQLEQFYHGRGVATVSEYARSVTGESYYLARRYQAMGLSYEFTPLLSAQLSIILNNIDHSRLYSINTIYSLSNESELSVSMAIPQGKEPEGMLVKSEFGSYPKTVQIELRAYF